MKGDHVSLLAAAASRRALTQGPLPRQAVSLVTLRC